VKAVVLGGVAWNIMVAVDRFPDPEPQTLFPKAMHEAVGSSGAGKALNLRSLGVEVSLWARIGDDEPGDHVRRAMHDAGVWFVEELDPLGTARHINLMDASGERMSMIVSPGSVDAAPDVTPVAGLLADASFAAVTIMNHCRPFLPIIRDAGVPLWIDIHDYDGVNTHHDEFISASDGLLMSTVAMRDWRGFAEEQVRGGRAIVICTHGARGASGLTADDGWVDVPAVPAEVVDTNGAGDAFFAGFIVARSAGASLRSSLEAGAEQAARAVQSPDLAPPI
jgi:acarbose 7IV-phosphotransferase